MRENKMAEIGSISRLALVVTIDLFSVFLIVLNILLKWDGWTIPIFIATIAITTFTYILNYLPQRMGIHAYSVILIFEVFYYTVNAQTTYDSTPVVVLMLVILGITQEPALLWSGYVMSAVGVFYALFMKRTKGDLVMELSYIVRTEWHLLLMLIAVVTVQMLLSSIKRIVRQLNDRIGVLESENQTASDFLTNVSHEIRTPVNAVTGLAALELENEKDSTKQERLRDIYKAGNRVAEQISDIMDYSEIDMNRLSVNEEDYMMSSLLSDLTSQLSSHMKSNVEVVMDVDVKLPNVIHGDVSKIKKIMWHLITNAIKFTHEGGVYVQIGYDKQPYGINLNITVEDTGVGMDEWEQQASFRRFYQADSMRTRSNGGLGLGIPIVMGFLQVLGGFLYVESAPGEGTVMRVTIPQKVVDSSRCVYLEKPEDICAACFLNYRDITLPEVREYYNRTIKHVADGVKVALHRVENIDNLKRLVNKLELTHIFLGESEYRRYADYIEGLSEKIIVTVIARMDIRIRKDSKVRLIRKPLYCFPVLNILNYGTVDDKTVGELYLPGVHALVVDDEPMNLTVANSIFTKYGMEVTTAASGMESINLCSTNDYDIVFMDHMMPGMDGVEAMKRIRSEGRHRGVEIPIVALTANALSSAREMFIAEGFDGFVSKPIELTELERVLKKILPKSAISFRDRDAEDVAAKEAEKPEVDMDLFEELGKLGIDTAKGMHYSQDDRDFYILLLRQFAGEAAEKGKKAEDFLMVSNLPEYAVIAHSIKSTSRMVGAASLSSKAEKMEKAAKAFDRDTVDEGHGEMMADYYNITDAILRLLKDTDTGLSNEEASKDIMPRNATVFEFLPKGDKH